MNNQPDECSMLKWWNVISNLIFVLAFFLILKMEKYLPTSVRLIREFLVAELKKSTRHLYTPPSWSCTFLICSRAFLLLLSSMAKNRRSPKSFAMAECVPNLTFLSRESMLCCGTNTKWIFILFFPNAWFVHVVFSPFTIRQHQMKDVLFQNLLRIVTFVWFKIHNKMDANKTLIDL